MSRLLGCAYDATNCVIEAAVAMGTVRIGLQLVDLTTLDRVNP